MINTNVIMLVSMAVVFVVMNFFSTKEQTQKQAQRQEMLNSLKEGDLVQLNNGMIGQIIEINNKRLMCRVGNVELHFNLESVTSKLD